MTTIKKEWKEYLRSKKKIMSNCIGFFSIYYL
jgi:[histone H3]-lysine4 N-trimethyltransferase ATXR3